MRFALRQLTRTPGFTTVVVLTIGLGIGSLSAVFSLVHAVLLEGLPFEHADRIVFVRGVRTADQGPQPFPLGTMDIGALSTGADSPFVAVSPVTGNRPFNMRAGSETAHVNGEMVGPDYFPILGVGTSLGRVFSADEAAAGTAQAVVVLSDGLWRTRFGGDPEVLTQRLELNDRVYRIIGVAAPGFRGLSDSASLWLPIGMAGPIYGAHYLQTREFRWLSAVARLRDDVSIARAREASELVAGQLREAFPRENSRLGFSVVALEEEFLGDLRAPLIALFCAAAFVLLIGCANVANMLLARGQARSGELAVRRALGASVRQLAALLLTETAMLCGAGAVLGLGLAAALPRAAVALAPSGVGTLVSVGFNASVVAFTLATTVVAAVLSGLVPAVLVLRHPAAQALRAGSPGSGGGAERRFQQALVVAEVSLALALLIGATGMTRGFLGFLSSDLGLTPKGVMTARLDLTADRFKDNERYWSLVRDVLARVQTVPGVSDVAIEGPGFPTGGSYAFNFRRVGAAPTDPDVTGLRHHVTPGYFATLGIPLRAGRDFSAQDVAGADRALIVSRAFAERVWPGVSAVGQRLMAGQAPDAPVLTVVGIVDNVRHSGRSSAQAWAPDVYISLLQSPARSPAALTVFARSPELAPGAAAALSTAVRDASQGVPPYDAQPLAARLNAQTAGPRFAVVVMGAFAAVALLLSMSGVYGVVSYVVGRRTREVALRLALGASRVRVLTLMLRLGLTPVLAGTVMGLGVAIWGGRYMTSQLYGLPATDPTTIVGMVALLAMVAAVATLIPALRATRVAPSIALRGE